MRVGLGVESSNGPVGIGYRVLRPPPRGLWVSDLGLKVAPTSYLASPCLLGTAHHSEAERQSDRETDRESVALLACYS